MKWFSFSIHANSHKLLSRFVHSSFYLDHYEVGQVSMLANILVLDMPCNRLAV